MAATGSRLLEALHATTAEDPGIGDVRGWGLAVSLDIVDGATGRPDPDRTTRIVEDMRSRGVLIGRTGRLDSPSFSTGVRDQPFRGSSSEPRGQTLA